MERWRDWPSLIQQGSAWHTSRSQDASFAGSALVTGLCFVCLGITCFDLKVEKSLMILSFHSFRAVTFEKLVKEIKKKKAESAVIHSFLLLTFWGICFVCTCPVLIESKPGRQTVLGTAWGLLMAYTGKELCSSSFLVMLCRNLVCCRSCKPLADIWSICSEEFIIFAVLCTFLFSPHSARGALHTRLTTCRAPT